MKKILSYILIPVILLSILGFWGKAYAQGTCTIYYQSQASPTVIQNVSEQSCKRGEVYAQYSSNSDFDRVGWVVNTTGTPSTPPTQPTNPTPTTPAPVTPGTPTAPQPSTTSTGTCSIVFTSVLAPQIIDRNASRADCLGPNGRLFLAHNRTADFSTTTWVENREETAAPSSGNALENNLSCSVLDIGGCVVYIFYYLFYVLPSLLLGVAANFFNVILALTISSALYTDATFIDAAWGTVRDLSNIAFLMVLLYIAIKIILGMTGHGTKETIAQVVVMALLINFSMFFTKVVIDSSNILALIFYNKIHVVAVSEDGTKQPITYVPVVSVTATGIQDKDISGALVSVFNPAKLLDQDFFDKLKTHTIGTTGLVASGAAGAAIGSFVPVIGTIAGGIIGAVAYTLKGASVPPGLLIGIITISGAIMGFAAYALFRGALALLARMIELWILIIASPFAFMSSVVPGLKDIEFVGWKSWIKHLFNTSFLAPIFLFFLYLIFILIQDNIFQNIADRKYAEQNWLEAIVLLIIPAAVILILLNKAVSYAKKTSGVVGQAVTSGFTAAAGLALGGAGLGLATFGRATLGKFMKEASTGDSAAQRYDRTQRTGVNEMRGRFDTFQGRAAQFLTRGRMAQWQDSVGRRINADQQHLAHVSHDRHDLDTAASEVTHGSKKKWSELTAEERFEARRKIARDRMVRENAGDASAGPVNPLLRAQRITGRFGNRKWDSLSPAERDAIDRAIGAGPHSLTAGGYADTNTAGLLASYREKQSLRSTLLQSTVTGTYDPRKIANIIAKENSTAINKLAVGVTAALAMGLRSGFKGIGVNYGEGKGSFIKDLGHTITEALKSVKINVDLSHVGEEKKDDGHGHGGGGHH